MISSKRLWEFYKNNALNRCNGSAAATLWHPPVCSCKAFTWVHLKGVSSMCDRYRQ